MKRFKKYLFAAIAAALLLMCLPGAASAAGEDYDILSRDTHIIVSENNIAHVTETIVLNYAYPRHGFYYSVQYKGVGYYFINNEWQAVKYLQHVYDFDVQGYDFELSRESDDNGTRYLMAKIGDADEVVSGEQTYVITYTVNLGDNGQADFDEFYRNLFYWDYGYTTEQATFSIELPKDFDSSLVRATVGEYGSTDTSGVTWEKVGNTITGKVLGPLYGGEMVTLRAEFPDDYYTNETDPYAAWNIAAYVVSGICVLLALILWLAYGRDPKVYPTVEFYAPDGMTPAEAGYVIDGCVDNKDVVSLLLYWADKGFIQIVEHPHDDFELVKLKDLEGGRSYEQHMFAKLFAGRDSVFLHTLRQTFYETMTQTKSGIQLWFDSAKERRVFTKASKTARGFMSLLTMLPVIFALFTYSYRDIDLMGAVMLTAVFAGILALPVYLLVNLFEKWRSTPSSQRVTRLVIYTVVLVVLFAIYIFAVPALFASAGDFAALYITLATTAATLIMLPLAVVMRKRTQQGAAWYGKLLGFRNFIDKAEKDRIEKLVEENPSYFFNVLPYAYVLGVTDTWARKFDGIGVQPPDWYVGYSSGSMFNTILFTSFMTRGMGGFASAMVARPPSSNSGGGFGSGGFSGGGGFGGGGFSGGGFGGGGGGGSW